MPRPYYGWTVVGMTVVSMMIVMGLTNGIFGLFVKPVSAEFGLGRADMNSAMVLLSLGGMVATVLVGRLVDRVPMRPVMIVSALGLGGCLAGLGLSRSLMIDAAILLVPLPLCIQGAGNITMPVLIARWFRANRGRAMALGLLGLGMGSVIMPPLVGYLIAGEGWRTALVISGLCGGAVLATIFAFVRDRPSPEELEPESAAVIARHDAVQGSVGGAGEGPIGMGAVLGTPQFWMIGGSAGLTLGVTTSIHASIVPIAQDAGLGMAAAASLLSANGIGSFAGKLTLAALADRVNREALLCGFYLLIAILCCIPIGFKSYAALMILSFGIGVGTSLLPALYALLADRFGVASFGTVQGLTMPLFAIGVAVCLRFAGEVYDRTGGYDAMFLTYCGVLILAAAMIVANRYLPAPGRGKSARSLAGS